jgi:hypothetical protein
MNSQRLLTLRFLQRFCKVPSSSLFQSSVLGQQLVILVVGAACGAANVELSLRSHPPVWRRRKRLANQPFEIDRLLAFRN